MKKGVKCGPGCRCENCSNPATTCAAEKGKLTCGATSQYFIEAGVPLVSFRDLLEENAFHLSDRHNMQDYVPFILKEEEKRLQSEQLSVSFDHTVNSSCYHSLG